MMTPSKISSVLLSLTMLVALGGCMEKQEVSAPGSTLPEAVANQTLFILSEGNFNSGNSTLAYYDTETGTVSRDVFPLANNGAKLGDTGQSICCHNGTLWVVVNGSKVIFALDPKTLKEKGRITSEQLTSPRYIHFVSDTKAYITQMYDDKILIVNPQTYTVTGSIAAGLSGTPSCEQIIPYGDYVIVNCWSYQKEIIKIDTLSDKVCDRAEVGIQPASICLDKEGMLWVLTDGGGWKENPTGYETPKLIKMNPDTFEAGDSFSFSKEGSYGYITPSDLQVSPDGDAIFYLYDGSLWRMSIRDTALPSQPFIASVGVSPYSFTISPDGSEVYVADAIDYTQAGTVTRYSMSGEKSDEFAAGVCPGAFCWY